MSVLEMTTTYTRTVSASTIDRLGAGVLVLGLLLAPLWGRDQYYMNVLVMTVLNAALASGLAIVIRAGRLSLAQATFSGIGGYTSGLLVMKLGVEYWAALPLAGALAAAVGVLLGLTSLRLSGFFFAIATFTFSQIVIIILRAWTPVTGGMSGMFGLPVPSDVFGISFRDPLNYYYLALTAAALAVLVHYLCASGSRFGRGLIVLGEDEVLARALGVPATRYRLYAFALSSCIGGVVGSLSAHFIQGISPSDIQPIASIFIVVMVMAGGASSLAGPIVGAIVLTIVPELLRASAQWSMVFYGAFLLAYVYFFPKGLLPIARRIVLRALNIQTSGSAETPSLPSREKMFQPAAPKAGSSTPIFSFRGMVCRYGSLTVLDDIDWQIENGRINGLIGPNGAGKTTFFNVITGIAPLSAGTASWHGKGVRPRPEDMARLGISRTFQHARVLANHTVREALSLGAELPGGRPDAARIDWLIAKLDLGPVAGFRCGSLTHYQKRLVSIGVALASRCELLLLDEPFAGLDDTETEQLTGTIVDLHRATGNTILLIEHKLSVIMRICTNLTVLDHGKIIAHGDPKTVAANPNVIKAYLGDE